MNRWLPRISKFLVAFILFMVLFYVGMQWFVHDQVEKGVKEAVLRIPGLELNYSRLAVDASRAQVTLTEVDLKRGNERIFADKVVISDFDQNHEIPHTMNILAEGIVLPADSSHIGAFASLFKELGMVELHGNCQLAYSFDAEKAVLDVNHFQFQSPELGELVFKGGFGNIDLDEFREEKLVGLRIVGLDLTFTDSGLMNRVLDAYATHRNMAGEQARTFLSTEVSTLAVAARAADNARAEKAFRALGAFVEKPETIVIRATPEEPVPWLYFFMGRDVFESINLLELTVENRAIEKNQ